MQGNGAPNLWDRVWECMKRRRCKQKSVQDGAHRMESCGFWTGLAQKDTVVRHEVSTHDIMKAYRKDRFPTPGQVSKRP